jgi:putative transposase
MTYIRVKNMNNNNNIADIQSVICKYCGSGHIKKFGTYTDKSNNTTQYFWCNDCKRKFKLEDTLFKMKTPINQIAAAVSLYYEGLSLNEIKRMLKQIYNLEVSDFAIYNWITRFTKDAQQITKYYQPNISTIWHCDETVISIGLKNYWLLDVIDSKTRFLIASRLSPYRRVEDIQELLKEAYKKTGVIPSIIYTDSLKAYINSIPMTFGDKTQHIPVKKFADSPNNNLIERMHSTIRRRLKITRDLKKQETAELIIDGFLINYNYFRPHETLSTPDDDVTPAEKAGIQFPYSNWEHLIKHTPEARITIPKTYIEIPALQPIPITKIEMARMRVRNNERKMLENIRKSRKLTQRNLNKQGSIRIVR